MDLFTLWGKIAIDVSSAEETINSTMQQVDGLKSSLEGAERQSTTTGKTFSKGGSLQAGSVALGNFYTKIGNSVINLFKTFTKTGFAFDASMEAYQGQFKALLNDEGKAAQLVADLQLLAKVSPLGMEGLANNAVSLLNTGVALADIVPTLEMLGNLALGDTNKMDSIVRAYTQILSKGQLMAQEIYQLGDAGVPVREIMTMYGGEEFADGTWYATKMTDPSYKIMADSMVTAFQGATAEGGKWHDYMFQMMDTWNGQIDRLGEEGKENIGAFMNPFFEVAKNDVLPKINESLGEFGGWVTENQDALSKMADAISGLVTGGFDMILSAFEWVAENGEAVGTALTVIATGFALGAIAAHPYAAAVLAVAAGLAALQTGGSRTKEKLFTYSDDELATLQNYIDAVNAAKEAEAAYFESEMSQYDVEKNKAWLDTAAKAKAAEEEVNAIDGLMKAYENWLGTQGAEGAYLDVPVRPSEDSAAEMQAEIAGYELEGDASIHAAANSEALIQSALNQMDLTVDVTPKLKFGEKLAALFGFNGSHADGLDRVPFDGYRAILHKDEMVLRASEAAVYRGEKEPTRGSMRRRNTAEEAQPINVTMNFNGRTGSPYEIAAEVKNALEMLRWQT